MTGPVHISPDQTDTLTLLGTGDSKGVPRFWCACPVCTEARGVNGQPGVNRRTRTATLLRSGGQSALLDAGPDTHAGLARLNGPLVPDAVFISHAHNDHLLGLGDLLDYVRYAAGRLRVYAPPEVVPEIAARFPYAFPEGEGGRYSPSRRRACRWVRWSCGPSGCRTARTATATPTASTAPPGPGVTAGRRRSSRTPSAFRQSWPASGCARPAARAWTRWCSARPSRTSPARP
ncbi:MBL fold metallo-hydrolase [Deinococcus aquaticus]|uniref:MBL fold metallo-hydrolase n=1 Tax=Deinococcus aquaticus TaxID=328692 RepID=UPI00360BD66A